MRLEGGTDIRHGFADIRGKPYHNYVNLVSQ